MLNIKKYRWAKITTFVAILLFLITLTPLISTLAAPIVIATIPVGAFPYTIAVNPTTNKIYVSNRNGNSVSVINGATNTVSATIPLTGTHALTVNPVTNRIYVSTWTNKTIVVLDGTDNSTITTVTLPNSAGMVTVDTVNNRFLVHQYESGKVLIYNGATNNLIQSLDANPSNTNWDIKVNPATNRLYVSGATLKVFDYTTYALLASLTYSGLPSNIELNPSLNRLYVSDYFDGSLSVINTTDNSLVTKIPIFGGPNGVTINNSLNRIYVAQQATNLVAEVDGNTNTVLSNTTVGNNPYDIGVNTTTNRVYTANGAGSVSVLSITPVPTLTKVFGTASLPLANTTSLTFTLTNPDPDNSFSGLAFTDSLPAGLIVATPNNLTTTCNGTLTAVAGSSSVSYSGGSLVNGANCTISLNVKGTSLGVKNNQTGLLSSTETGTLLPSNVATLTVTGPASDIKVQKTVNNNIPIIGQAITFTVTVSNLGPNNNTGLKVSDVLTSGLDFVSATPTIGTYNPGTGEWDIGNLNNGQNAVLTIVTVVIQSTNQTNTASVTAQDVPDQDTTNNSAHVTILPQGIGIVVTKPTDDGQGTLTGSLSWAITQANGGNIKTIIFADNINSVLMTDGILPDVGSGVYIQGRCPNGPGITINGGGRTGNGLVIKGSVTLYGLKITNFNGIQIKASTENGKNTLVCVKASRFP